PRRARGAGAGRTRQGDPRADGGRYHPRTGLRRRAEGARLIAVTSPFRRKGGAKRTRAQRDEGDGSCGGRSDVSGASPPNPPFGGFDPLPAEGSERASASEKPSRSTRLRKRLRHVEHAVGEAHSLSYQPSTLTK